MQAPNIAQIMMRLKMQPINLDGVRKPAKVDILSLMTFHTHKDFDQFFITRSNLFFGYQLSLQYRQGGFSI